MRIKGEPTVILGGKALDVDQMLGQSLEPYDEIYAGASFTCSAQMERGSFEGLCALASKAWRVEQPTLVITVNRYSVGDAILGRAMAERQPIEGDLAEAYSAIGLVWVTAAEDDGEGRVAYTIRSTP